MWSATDLSIYQLWYSRKRNVGQIPQKKKTEKMLGEYLKRKNKNRNQLVA